MRRYDDNRRHAARISVFLLRYSGITFCAAFLLLSLGHYRHVLNSKAAYSFDRTLAAQKVEPEPSLATPVQDFGAGVLNVEPVYYSQCTTVRFRGDPGNYTVAEAIELLQRNYQARPGPRSLRMGIQFMETPKRFFPVRISESSGSYHMFHFVEMLVIAYSELHRIASALPPSQTATVITGTTLARGSPAVSVPWIVSPFMTKSEICGGASGINCVIADLAFRASNASIFQDKSGILGLDSMESHKYNSQAERKEKAVARRIQLAAATYGPPSQGTREITDQADGVIVIERFGCKAAGTNKPWVGHIEGFPTDNWNADVMAGMGQSPDHKTDSKQRIVVGYIDRQNTGRKIPDEHHLWLVDNLSKHAKIQFLHLHMETYPAIEQLKIAAGCDVLIGVHGNGMTHSFWMTPRRYVIELFWRFPFQYDYATTAQLMKHNYLGILNGKALDGDMLARRDPALRQNKKATTKASEEECSSAFEQEGKAAIRDFIEQAILDLLPVSNASDDVRVFSWLVHA